MYACKNMVLMKIRPSSKKTKSIKKKSHKKIKIDIDVSVLKLKVCVQHGMTHNVQQTLQGKEILVVFQ
jgi:hypothetical protein